MYTVKLVQVVSIVEVIPEICILYIFLGAQRFQSIVGAEGFVVERVKFIYPRQKSHGKSNRMRLNGARVNDIIAARNDATTGSHYNTLLILHIGTNDVKASRSEELIEKYKRLIHQYKEKSNNIIVSCILPRMNESDAFNNKAFSTSNRLKSLCAQEYVEFANFWDSFFCAHHLYQFDSVHLNSVGADRFS